MSRAGGSCASHLFLTGINSDLKQSWVILHNFLNDLSVCLMELSSRY